MIKRGYIGGELRDPCMLISGTDLSRLFAVATPGKSAKLIIEAGDPWAHNRATVRCGKSESSIMVITNGMPVKATMTAVQCFRIGMVAVLAKDSRVSIRPLSMKVDLRQVTI